MGVDNNVAIMELLSRSLWTLHPWLVPSSLAVKPINQAIEAGIPKHVMMGMCFGQAK